MGSQTVWSEFKAFFRGLPWYWKAIIIVALPLLVAGVVIRYVLGRRSGGEVTNEMLVDHSRAQTDQAVDTFRTDEQVREERRQELRQKRDVIKTEMEKRHEEHETLMQEIAAADTGDELLALAKRIREQQP